MMGGDDMGGGDWPFGVVASNLTRKSPVKILASPHATPHTVYHRT
jgi:hypothetical protein